MSRRTYATALVPLLGFALPCAGAAGTDLDHDQAGKLAERLRQEIANHTFVGHLELTISAGVAR